MRFAWFPEFQKPCCDPVPGLVFSLAVDSSLDHVTGIRMRDGDDPQEMWVGLGVGRGSLRVLIEVYGGRVRPIP